MAKPKIKNNVIRVKQTSGWIVVSSKTHKVVAHAKTFSEIVALGEKFDPQTHAIMSASPSYRYQLMITVKA